jgi:spore coat polysaccharide biosynthesis predicted glycosyltransferase SpsG
MQSYGYKLYLLTLSDTNELSDDQKNCFYGIIPGCSETYLLRKINHPICVIIDNYKLGSEVHAQYRNLGSLVICIDDLTQKRYMCDVLFDGGLTRRTKDYFGLMDNPDCKLYVGPEYSFVDMDFRDHYINGNFEVTSNQIYLSLGGYDKNQLTNKLVSDLSAIFPSKCFCVPNTRGRLNLKSLSNLIELTSREEMILASARSYCGVGAGGTMVYERNSVCLPTFHIVIAENQLDMSKDMKKLVGSPYHIFIDEDGYSEVIDDVSRFIEDKARISKIRKKLSTLPNNLGINNIVEIIINAIN